MIEINSLLAITKINKKVNFLDFLLKLTGIYLLASYWKFSEEDFPFSVSTKRI